MQFSCQFLFVQVAFFHSSQTGKGDVVKEMNPTSDTQCPLCCNPLCYVVEQRGFNTNACYQLGNLFIKIYCKPCIVFLPLHNYDLLCDAAAHKLVFGCNMIKLTTF